MGVVSPVNRVGAAPTITVKGQAPGAARVLLLTSKGRAYSAAASGNGAFTIKSIPSASVKNATLQFVDASGKYLGPAVLKVVKKGKTFTSILGLKSIKKGTLNVGKLTAQKGWYKAKKASAAGTSGVRAADKTGRPKGAGTAGRVKLSSAKVSSMSAVSKFATTKCPDGSPKDVALNGTEPGMDLDCDGLPNVIDVDDNGNGSLDIVDQASNDSEDKANFTGSLSTYSGISASQSAKLNIHASDAATLVKQIKTALGANAASAIQGGFSIAIFLQESTISGTAGVTPDSVYIDCPGIKWCDIATSTALIQGNSELNEVRNLIDGKPWKTFASTDFSTGKPVQSTTATANGMYRFGQGQNTIWAAFFSPNYDGDDVLSVVRANDVVLIRSSKGGVESTLPVTISPFFVTTPYITAVTATGTADTNTAANVAAGYTAVGTDGKMTVTFRRPQRMLLEGETGESANANFVSQHGLHYGLVPSQASVGGKDYRATSEFGCGGSDAASLYNTTSSAFEVQTQAYGPVDKDPASDFWPLFDNTADDSTDDPLTFTIDLKSCFTNHKPGALGGGTATAGKTVAELMGFTWDQFASGAGNYIDFSLTGTGAPSTNGYNRSTLAFRVYSPAWNGQAPSGNNNSGSNNNSGNNNSGGGSSSSPTIIEVLVTNGSTGQVSISNVASCTSPLSAGGSCSGAASTGTVVLDAAGGATAIQLDTGNTAPDLVSSNACAQTSGSKLTCTIASGQGNKKISVTTS
jgi:hypothetical protein